MIRALLALLLLAPPLSACGKVGPPRQPGPASEIIYPRVYPAPDPPPRPPAATAAPAASPPAGPAAAAPAGR